MFICEVGRSSLLTYLSCAWQVVHILAVVSAEPSLEANKDPPFLFPKRQLLAGIFLILSCNAKFFTCHEKYIH